MRQLQLVVRDLEKRLESLDGERSDVTKALASARAAIDALSGSGTSTGPEGDVSHTGKYKPLFDHLRKHHREGRLEMTFKQIEDVLGFSLPPSSRKYVPHWHSYDGSAVVRAIHDAGWRAHNVDLVNQTVQFRLADN